MNKEDSTDLSFTIVPMGSGGAFFIRVPFSCIIVSIYSLRHLPFTQPTLPTSSLMPCQPPLLTLTALCNHLGNSQLS